MATWKKVAVSGSNISQFNNDAGYLTSEVAQHAFTTASFNGTNLLADSSQGTLNFASGSGQGLTISATAGTDTLTFGLSSIPNSSLANSTIYISGSGISNEGSVALGATASIDVQVDDSTIEISGDQLQVKDGGIGTTQIADSLGTIGENSFTGSFSGSFTGDVTIDLADLSEGTGIVPFTYDGNSTTTVAISGAAALTDNIITKWDATDGKFVDSSLTDNGTTITGTTSIQLTGASSNLSGSFSGSFEGDGSGLTGVGSLANALTDTAGGGLTDFSFDGSSAVNIAVSGAADLSNNTVVKWDNTANKFANTIATDNGSTFTITGNSLITGDLTVQGTASFQHNEELQVADRFVLFASGSNTTGDGGIVVQQGTQNIGELFAYDSATTRWGLTSSFDASNTAYTPDAFIAAVVEGTGTDPDATPARYDKKGNIFVGTDEGIWIYS